MSRRYITAAEQHQIIQRAQRQCEYCRSPMDYSPQPFDIEHIIPIAHGGETHLDNLALACGGCNSHKYTKTQAIDPISQKIVDLFHPRQHDWPVHFVWSQDCVEVLGITSIGRATVSALNLNRAGVINLRKILLLANLHPPG